jgi:hypothetical protein
MKREQFQKRIYAQAYHTLQFQLQCSVEIHQSPHHDCLAGVGWDVVMSRINHGKY